MSSEKEIDAGRVITALKYGAAFAFLGISLAVAIPVFIARGQAGVACRSLRSALPQLPVKVADIRFIKHPTSERCDVVATVADQDDERILREFLSSRLTEQQRGLTRIVIELSGTAPHAGTGAR